MNSVVFPVSRKNPPLADAHGRSPPASEKHFFLKAFYFFPFRLPVAALFLILLVAGN